MGKLLREINSIFGFFRKILNALTFKFNWGENRIKDHPKISRIYKKGVGGRILIFLFCLVTFAVTIFCEFGLVASFANGEIATGIFLLIPTYFCFRFGVDWIMTFCCLGFNQFVKAIRRKKENNRRKKQEEEREREREQRERELSPTIGEQNEHYIISEQVVVEGEVVASKGEAEKENTPEQESDNKELKEYKPHKFLDFTFGLLGAILSVAVPVIFIVLIYFAPVMFA